MYVSLGYVLSFAIASIFILPCFSSPSVARSLDLRIRVHSIYRSCTELPNLAKAGDLNKHKQPPWSECVLFVQ